MVFYQALIISWLLELVPNWAIPSEDILKGVLEEWAKHLPKQWQNKAPEPDITPKEIPRVEVSSFNGNLNLLF